MTAPRVTTVGLDVGGTKCLGVVLGPTGEVMAEHRVPTPRDAAGLVEAAAELVTELRGTVPGVTAVGVGAPGLVDRDGVLRAAPNLPEIHELPLRSELEQRVDLPVRAENDATCATWGEREMGAARDVDDLLMVTLGTGVGGGIVTDGTIYRGANGFAGEIGHVVVDPQGPLCTCGQRGCWERYASGSGLGRLGREAALAGRARRVVELAGGDAESVRGEHVTRAAQEGDDDALAVMHEFDGWVALGLANLANIFDPALFVIGGGLVAAGDLLFGPTVAAFDALVAPRHRPRIPVVPARLGERAGAIGAAALARSA